MIAWKRAWWMAGAVVATIAGVAVEGGAQPPAAPSSDAPQREEEARPETPPQARALRPFRRFIAGSATHRRIETRTYHFEDAQREMEYALFVPSTYDKETKTPLVVALHGLGSNPQQIIRYPQLTDLAEKHGYIVVAPMGFNERGWYGSRGPRSRRNDPENLGELSERDVMNVLARTRAEFAIDDDRTYLMGHSMGGAGTWHLAIEHPELWAALAPIAPAPSIEGSDALEKIKHIPVIVIQGDEDLLVRATGTRRWVEKMKELDMEHDYIEVKGGGHIDVAFENIPRVFEFFEKHQRRKPPGGEPRASDD